MLSLFYNKLIMHIECKYNNAKLILPVMMITWRVLQGLVGEAAWELLAA